MIYISTSDKFFKKAKNGGDSIYIKSTFGSEGRLYRSPNEIKSDIEEVAERLSLIKEMLNVRSLISEVISDQSEGEPKRSAEAINELIEYADEALCEMKELNEVLSELRCELLDTVRFFGGR